jgi:hypothetical protein
VFAILIFARSELYEQNPYSECWTLSAVTASTLHGSATTAVVSSEPTVSKIAAGVRGQKAVIDSDSSASAGKK